jgi:hypothetical protein
MLATILLGCSAATVIPSEGPSVEELKAKIASTSVADRPHLCVQIAEKQLNEVDKLYGGSDPEKAQEALTDVIAYSELARDYAIQSHKYQKQAEIAVRGMTRKLNNLLHALGHEEQRPVKEAVDRLERVRDDLLASMFKKDGK